jgi:hypothetical protein
MFQTMIKKSARKNQCGSKTRRCLGSSNQKISPVTESHDDDEQRRQHQLIKSFLEKERESLREEASAMTKSLYRTCIRSVRVIRYGNDHDEMIFQKLEEKRVSPQRKDGGFSMISMLPPVDRENELRSRSEYYLQYARETFFAESDCLSHDEWDSYRIDRYLHHLRKADTHRKWLLSDMKFPDPYENSFDWSRMEAFKKRTVACIEKMEDLKYADDPEMLEILRKGREGIGYDENYEEEDDTWSSDEEDDDDAGPKPGIKHPRKPYPV